MLTPEQIAIVKATVPALEAHGETITRTFYGSMFAAHPELLDIFNPANQKTGKQARSLAASVLAYARFIDQPQMLGDMVQRIAEKHVSLQVLPEQYPIVGKHLLGAIAEVLGDAATPEILDAWAAAYGVLADTLIKVEGDKYDAGAALSGGWRDFKPFKVLGKTPESSVITSFVLAPADGAALPPYLPGQFISLKIKVPGQEHWQIRQYSLSDTPNGKTYRISVKREDGGLISDYLHQQLKDGDEVLVHMPAGDFVLHDSDKPVVFLSGGVGITPVLSMLRGLLQSGSQRPVTFIHAAQNGSVHAFGPELSELVRQYPHLQKVVLYAEPAAGEEQGKHYDIAGLVGLETLRHTLPSGPAEYYYCGPTGFVAATEKMLDELQVSAQQRHTETFGPSQSFELLLNA